MTDAFRDAELLAGAVADVVDGADERDSLAGYQLTRDAVAGEMLEVADAIGGHRWTEAEIPSLLLRLNAAANDGLETVSGLDAELVT